MYIYITLMVEKFITSELKRSQITHTHIHTDTYTHIQILKWLHFLNTLKKFQLSKKDWWQHFELNNNSTICNTINNLIIRNIYQYELSSCVFEFRYCHLNFRYGACFEQRVSWHSGKLWSVDSLWNS